MVTYSPLAVPLSDLLLDPNNFRFRSPAEGPDILESRFVEPSVQAGALERIKDDGVAELKRSIAENGFVPVERIVVRALEETAEDGRQYYVAVEGNRRTAALKLLQLDNAGGVALSDEVVAVFSDVPVLLAADATSEDLLAIMGIRHVGGPKEWGGYQSALLVYQMIEDGGAGAREVASRLSLTVNEVNRRYRAFSALTQMLQDEEYGESVHRDMYPIFHEAVGQPAVRDWLEWSQSNRVFEHDANRELFYSWIQGGNEAKITSYSEVRELKMILDNADALTALKDDDQSFSDALAIVRADAKSARWFPNAKSALGSLNEMGSDTIERLQSEELTVLKELKNRSSWIIRAQAISEEAHDEDS
jgi:ParB-like chromosome segregation protein Spo0J